MGLLGEDTPSNKLAPKDFSTQRDEDLPLSGGASLSGEIIIKA